MQLAAEVQGCLSLVKIIFKTLDIKEYRVRVGLRDPDSSKYVGAPEKWDRAEESCRQAARHAFGAAAAHQRQGVQPGRELHDEVVVGVGDRAVDGETEGAHTREVQRHGAIGTGDGADGAMAGFPPRQSGR